VRHDNQPVDLLVAGVGKREHRPVGRAFARRLLHAAHDAVRARRRRHLNAVGVGLVNLDDGGEVNRGDVRPHSHRLDGMTLRSAQQGADQDCRKTGGAKKAQTTTSGSALDPLLNPSLSCPSQELSP
jgi:hypothetical protein